MAVPLTTTDTVWLGIDWGTSNCAVAVYDRHRGGCKWLRLPEIGGIVRDKVGRLVPTVLVVATDDYVTSSSRADHSNNAIAWHDVSDLLQSQSTNAKDIKLWACFGAVAQDLITVESPTVQAATIQSVKRHILQAVSNGDIDTTTLTLTVTPLGCTDPVTLDVVSVVAVMVRQLQRAAILAVQRHRRQSRKPQWDIPMSGGTVPLRMNEPSVAACLGAPAATPHTYRPWLQHAATRAGLVTAWTVTESTAAAMAYGLLTTTTRATVLVFDMGGGTTDVTIAERSHAVPLSTTDSDTSGFHVCVTVGHDRLGGDDMDEALLTLVQRKVQIHYPHATCDSKWKQALLRRCRAAKLSLCGGIPPDAKPAPSVTVTLPLAWLVVSPDGASATTAGATTVSVTMTQDDWHMALAPIVEQAKLLMDRALLQYNAYVECHHDPPDDTSRASQRPQQVEPYPFDEVILIGGASRVPGIRRLLQDMALTRHDLCTSVNADSAVAQGCAVAAAVESGTVPLHEIQSALMLDTIPHPMGVLCGSSVTALRDAFSFDATQFVELLPRYATLPANGHATFQLAQAQQAGVTLQAVERIDDDQCVTLGDFTFLLHRLTAEQIAALPNGVRSIDIGMTLRPNGEFVVSIFDDNDPDHRRKRERVHGTRASETRSFHPAKVDDTVSLEQISLIGASLVLFLLYVVAKLWFQDISALQTTSSSVAPL